MKGYLGQLLIVGCGGFIGSGARFALGGLIYRMFPTVAFPYGTLTVNLVGCLIIGLMGGLMDSRHVLGPSQRLFLMVGVLGGFTTYSTFAYETLGLAHASDFARAAANVVAHVALGLLAAWAGYFAAQQLG